MLEKVKDIVHSRSKEVDGFLFDSYFVFTLMNWEVVTHCGQIELCSNLLLFFLHSDDSEDALNSRTVDELDAPSE